MVLLSDPGRFITDVVDSNVFSSSQGTVEFVCSQGVLTESQQPLSHVNLVFSGIPHVDGWLEEFDLHI